MTLVWLATLLVYGCLFGLGHIAPLFWLLLAPMILQDIYDNRRRRR
jgi:hypothetical protein